ncbi:hypothetical protein VP01_9g11 [Puccinia sorghi]|uniref:Heme haloperoxidase family profile domain-containing protein n=1 Tax=Puccinia sorghi TaxID=27349 RepID=A0A0L6U556_9BASI|nr:hypothetical protein VP01_9g11 [Puccinia sorghi]
MCRGLIQEKSNRIHNLLENPGSGPDKAHPYRRKLLGSFFSSLLKDTWEVENAKQQIPIQKLMVALVECYNLSWTFAIIFAIVGTLRMGKIFSFSIQELGRHGKIEHDASMTRFDAGKGDALNPSTELIEQLFESDVRSNAKTVTLLEFAKKKVELESRITEYDAQSKAEINFVRPSSEHLKDVGMTHNGRFYEERLPVELGWKKPASRITLLGTLGLMKRMKTIQDSWGGEAGGWVETRDW